MHGRDDSGALCAATSAAQREAVVGQALGRLWEDLRERRYVLHEGVQAVLADTLRPYLLVRGERGQGEREWEGHAAPVSADTCHSGC